MPYIKNADLTVEAIVARAFALGATQIYSDIRPGYHRCIVMEWPGAGLESYPMEPYTVNGWQMSFANSLPSMRKFVEMSGAALKSRMKE